MSVETLRSGKVRHLRQGRARGLDEHKVKYSFYRLSRASHCAGVVEKSGRRS